MDDGRRTTDDGRRTTDDDQGLCLLEVEALPDDQVSSGGAIRAPPRSLLPEGVVRRAVCDELLHLMNDAVLDREDVHLVLVEDLAVTLTVRVVQRDDALIPTHEFSHIHPERSVRTGEQLPEGRQDGVSPLARGRI